MKQMFGFKADANYMDYLDKLVSLSQFGMTETVYKTRSDFILAAIAREAERFYLEVSKVPMLAPLAKTLHQTHDGEKLIKGSLIDEENRS